MKKTRPMLRWAGIVVLGVMFIVNGSPVWAEQAAAPTTAPGKPDQITINTLAAFEKARVTPGNLPPRPAHPSPGQGQQGLRNLPLCRGQQAFLHLPAPPRPPGPKKSRTFIMPTASAAMPGQRRRAKRPDPQDGFCRSCHNAELARDHGPAGCRPGQGLALPASGFQGYRPRSAAGQDNCNACHHEYDQAAKKLVYVTGQEGSCRYCHLEQPHDGIRSLQQAAHEQCLSCHQDLAKKGLKGPLPVTCNGCHSAEAQAAVAKQNQEMVAKLPDREIPRLQRDQPDATLVMFEAKTPRGKRPKPSPCRRFPLIMPPTKNTAIPAGSAIMPPWTPAANATPWAGPRKAALSPLNRPCTVPPASRAAPAAMPPNRPRPTVPGAITIWPRPNRPTRTTASFVICRCPAR